MQLKKIGAVRKKMNGKTNNDVTLQQLFDMQLDNQNKLIAKGLYNRYKNENTSVVPTDDVGLSSYHIQQLMSEIGEVLDADKRWKSHRNEKYNKDAKLEELADCFIVLMNIVMFSDFDGNDLAKAIKEKLSVVSNRLNEL